ELVIGPAAAKDLLLQGVLVPPVVAVPLSLDQHFVDPGHQGVLGQLPVLRLAQQTFGLVDPAADMLALVLGRGALAALDPLQQAQHVDEYRIDGFGEFGAHCRFGTANSENCSSTGLPRALTSSRRSPCSLSRLRIRLSCKRMASVCVASTSFQAAFWRLT